MVQNRSKALRGLLFTLYNLRVKNVQELPGGVCRLTDQAGFLESKDFTSSTVNPENKAISSGIGPPVFFFQEHSTIIPSFLQANAICKFYGIIKVSPLPAHQYCKYCKNKNPRTERLSILCGGMLALWFTPQSRNLPSIRKITGCCSGRSRSGSDRSCLPACTRCRWSRCPECR